jgi:hypothetical protein
MESTVDDEPNFFEGTDQDGAGPGPHFITMSFVKDKKKIRINFSRLGLTPYPF